MSLSRSQRLTCRTILASRGQGYHETTSPVWRRTVPVEPSRRVKSRLSAASPGCHQPCARERRSERRPLQRAVLGAERVQRGRDHPQVVGIDPAAAHTQRGRRSRRGPARRTVARSSSLRRCVRWGRPCRRGSARRPRAGLLSARRRGQRSGGRGAARCHRPERPCATARGSGRGPPRTPSRWPSSTGATVTWCAVQPVVEALREVEEGRSASRVSHRASTPAPRP